MKHPNKHKLTKQQLWIFTGIGVLVVLAIIAVAIICLSSDSALDMSGQVEDETQTTTAMVDFNQRITDVDGSDLQQLNYEKGSGGEFAIRFVGLQCVDATCSNVETVSLDDNVLVRGKDYEVKQGSVIIMLFGDLWDTLPVDDYNIIVKIKLDDTMKLVGARIHVSDNTICTDGQILEGGRCVDEKDNTSSSSGTSQPSNNNTASTSTTPNKPSGSNNNNETKPTQPSGGNTTPVSPTTPTTPTTPQEPPRPEFNLNDNYWVKYIVAQWKLLDADGNVIPTGPLKARGWCDISRTESGAENGPYIKQVLFTSDRKNLTETQVQEDIRRWETELGLSGYTGGGWIKPLDEWHCDQCGLSCGRW